MKQKLLQYYKRHTESIWVCSLLFISLTIYNTPFLLYGNHSLGYDTGFYRRYIINPLVSIPNTSVPGVDHTIIVPRIFLDMFRMLGFSPDTTLYGSYFVVLLIFILVLYIFLREFVSKKIAIPSLLILSFSPIQYLAFWFMLYKNFFALIFFFLTFIFLRRKWYIFSAITAVIIPLSHQSTTIIFLMVLATYIGVELVLRKKVLLQELIILVATLFVYLYLHPHIQQKIDAPPVGVFIEKLDFLFFSLPLIILTVIGRSAFWKILKQEGLLLAFGIIAVFFPLLSLPYYQRILLFTHYWLLLGSVFGVELLLMWSIKHTQHTHRYSRSVLVGIFIFQIALLTYQVYTLRPLITSKARAEISSLQENVPDNSHILTSPRFTPWVQGWTLSKVYAPGILKDRHPSWEWQMYWSGSDKTKVDFLSTFPKPLYIFIDEDQKKLFIPNNPCVQKISDMLYRDDC